MILALLLESAVRSLALGAAVGLGLKALRVRSTHVQMAAWTFVLAAAIGMPILMRLAAVPIPAPAISAVQVLRPVAPSAPLLAPRVGQILRPAVPAAASWRVCATSVLAAGALLLLLRLLTGLLIAWKLWRSARPISEPWGKISDIRVSGSIQSPVTFASTILLPPESLTWTPLLRDAVIAHERSHIVHGDFYRQLAASLYRAIFWFSPLAWWLQKRLVELAETRSDDAALGAMGDRLSYAQMLLELADKRLQIPSVVAMARTATVARRVERILAGTSISEAMNWKRRMLLVAGLVPAITLAAGCSMQARSQRTPSPPPAQAAPASSNTKEQSSNAGIAANPRAVVSVRAESIVAGGASGEGYAIVMGGTILFQEGPAALTGRVQALRSEIKGDFIWFDRNLKHYYITDSDFLKRAKDLMAPQEQLGRMQADLGSQQARLGAVQAGLGAQQSSVAVKAPDLTPQLDALRADMDRVRDQFGHSAGKELRQDDLGALQARVGDIQARIGELQAQAGPEQSRLGAEQARVGDQQARLGEQQARLGEQQAELAKQIDQQMYMLINEAIARGVARPVE